jgi:hypothetical protein
MSEPSLKAQIDETPRQEPTRAQPPSDKPNWETPQMQDVSEEVMAQPYIRFT